MTGKPALSVVLATHNRGPLLRRLLEQLATQTLPADQFEVIVVDDGSAEPAESFVKDLQTPYALKFVRQQNAGAAAARHNGLSVASGRIAVVTDDDMKVPSTFLEAHLRHHQDGQRRVVLGEIRPDEQLDAMPLFERLRAFHLRRLAVRWVEGSAKIVGNNVCSGNVSFPLADYKAVGGFDASLKRSEDAELGLRLEGAGLELVFDRDAHVLHASDHVDLQKWMASTERYGRFDQRIGDKHPGLAHADPYRYLFNQALPKRPLLALTLVAPWLAPPASRALMGLGDAIAGAGFERVALWAAGLAHDLQYFRGLREEAGTLSKTVHRVLEYRRKARRASAP